MGTELPLPGSPLERPAWSSRGHLQFPPAPPPQAAVPLLLLPPRATPGSSHPARPGQGRRAAPAPAHTPERARGSGTHGPGALGIPTARAGATPAPRNPAVPGDCTLSFPHSSWVWGEVCMGWHGRVLVAGEVGYGDGFSEKVLEGFLPVPQSQWRRLQDGPWRRPSQAKVV